MAHPDFQALVDSLMPFAKSMLSKHGGFNPFGGRMTVNGQIQWIAAHDGEELPPSQTLVDMMTGAMKICAAAGEIRATAICYDALAIAPGESSKTDAIGFSLENRAGESISVYLPYAKKGGGEIQYGIMFATRKPAQIFSTPSVVPQ